MLNECILLDAQARVGPGAQQIAVNWNSFLNTTGEISTQSFGTLEPIDRVARTKTELVKIEKILREF